MCLTFLLDSSFVVCLICGKAFLSWYFLKQHLGKCKKSTSTYYCANCEREFVTECQHRLHKKSVFFCKKRDAGKYPINFITYTDYTVKSLEYEGPGGSISLRLNVQWFNEFPSISKELTFPTNHETWIVIESSLILVNPQNSITIILL